MCKHRVCRRRGWALFYLRDRKVSALPSEDAAGEPVNVLITRLLGPQRAVEAAGAFNKSAIDGNGFDFIGPEQGFGWQKILFFDCLRNPALRFGFQAKTLVAGATNLNRGIRPQFKPTGVAGGRLLDDITRDH